MAFINDLGQSISYECGDLIDGLRQDIAKLGGHVLVDVVTEQIKGVTIYKDYFIPGSNGRSLSKGESIQKMTASALLLLYEKENSVF